MKTSKMVVLGVVLIIAAMLTACGRNRNDDNVASLDNLNFDAGDLSGWATSGNAFQRAGVVHDDVVEGFPAGRVGNYFFNGLEAGPQPFTGYMVSPPFTVEGTGHVAFMLGAAGNPELTYVAIIDAETGEVLARQGNVYFDGTFITTQMVRYVVDLTAHMGRRVQFKVVDNDSGHSFAYVLVADFIHLIETESDLARLRNEQITLLAALQPPPFEEDETLTTIQNPGFEYGFTGWKVLSGTAFNVAAIAPSADLFWGTREFHAVGNYFLNGYNNAESAVGQIRSSKFTLAGDGFISFLLGGAGNPNGFVSIHDGHTDAELFRIVNDFFRDPELSLNMVRRYVDASAYIGRVLYIKITDNMAGGPFGAITVDDFRVSMTQDEVQALVLETFNWAQSLYDTPENRFIRAFYETYDYPFELPVLRITVPAEGQAIFTTDSVDVEAFIADVRGELTAGAVITTGIESVVFDGAVITSGFDRVDMSVPGFYTVNYYVYNGGVRVTDSFIVAVSEDWDILNAGFESGNLAGWTVLTPNTLNPAFAVSGESTFWGEEIPFNNYGNFHFNGWGAQFYEGDAFSIRSTTFQLGGSGWISWRKGGNAAAVRVFLADGTHVADFLNTAFADINFPNLDEGSRLATMTSFAADLSAFLGEEMYIELHDIGGGPWGVAFFDNVVIYHETAPNVSELSDPIIFNRVYDGTLTPTEFNIPWELAVNVI